MSDIVSGVVKHTFGILANKIRKEVAERLKDGDVTDEECRRLIVGELDDIKSKLDGLARKDLLSSLCFLQEGINALCQSKLELPSDENTVESSERATLVEASSSRVVSPGSSSSFNEAADLINAIASLKIHSKERFKSAKESFKLSREKATEAFCNEALSIEDRIQASEIRMMARILEKLEDPEASLCDCLQYLKQLYDVGATGEIFSVLIDGGMKSRFNQVKRLNNASSVYVINRTLFDFARKFVRTNSTLAIMFRWPMILVGKKIHNPVFGETKLVEKLEESGVQVMSPYPDFTFGEIVTPSVARVNSKGEIVAYIHDPIKTIKIFKRSRTSRIVCELPMEEHAFETNIAAMDIGPEDNIYFITRFRKSDDESWSFKLFIFDENGNKKLETPLSFHQSLDYSTVSIAVNKDGRIVICDRDDEKNIIYIGNVHVETNSYEVVKSLCLSEFDFTICYPNLQFSDLNGTKVIVNGWRSVYIFAENGQLHCEIKIPDEYRSASSVAVNHVTKHILMKTYYNRRSSLLSFSESGELLYCSYLGSTTGINYAQITSHPNGPVALVYAEKAVLLQR